MTKIEEPKTATTLTPVEDELSSLGLTGASKRLKQAREYKRKMGIAYEHYRFVTMKQIEDFRTKLYQRTKRATPNFIGGFTYDTLKLTPLSNYDQVPPRNVLDKLKEAISFNIFQHFEVATVESVTKLPDPIIFGIVEGAWDIRFAIAEWDDDVKVSDLIKDDEG